MRMQRMTTVKSCKMVVSLNTNKVPRLIKQQLIEEEKSVVIACQGSVYPHKIFLSDCCVQADME